MPINYFPSLQQAKSADIRPAEAQNPAGSKGVDRLEDLLASVVAILNASPDYLEEAMGHPAAASLMTQGLAIYDKLAIA